MFCEPGQKAPQPRPKPSTRKTIPHLGGCAVLDADAGTALVSGTWGKGLGGTCFVHVDGFLVGYGEQARLGLGPFRGFLFHVR